MVIAGMALGVYPKCPACIYRYEPFIVSSFDMTRKVFMWMLTNALAVAYSKQQ